MARSLNFRSFEQPTLPICMNDAEGTMITVTAPSVELVERLEANQHTILAAFRGSEQEAIEELWNFAASLISCNREGVQVTAADLKGRYALSYQMLFAFYTAYGEFIDEIKAAKN